jgi:iron complex transport system substrate-binding protein
MIMLAGCGIGTSNEITGLDGQKIIKPAKVERIISTAPSNTEILTALDLGDKIIAADLFSQKVPGINKKAKTVDFMKADVEALISLKPDVIIASDINKMASGNPLDAVKKANIPIIYVPTPKTYQEITKQIAFLGQFTNHESQGQKVLDQMDKTYQGIVKKAKKIPQDKIKKVYVEISGEPSLFSLGDNTFLNDFLRIIKADNIFAKQDGWFQPNVENILKANPDVIITTESFNPKAVANILNRKAFNSIKSVKNKKVYVINQDLSSRASQNSIKALEQLAKIIYPEYYE